MNNQDYQNLLLILPLEEWMVSLCDVCLTVYIYVCIIICVYTVCKYACTYVRSWF